MSKRLRKYLESIGLNSGADEKAAWAFFKGLNETQIAKAKEIGALTGTEAEQAQQLADQAEATATAARNLANASETEAPTDANNGTDSNASQVGSRKGGTAPAPQASQPAPASNQDVDSIRREAVAAERTRVAEIRGLATRLGLHDAWASQMIDGGFTIEQARTAALDKIATGAQPLRLSVVADNNIDSLADGVADAVLDRAKITLYAFDANGEIKLGTDGKPVRRPEPHGRARQFRSQRLVNVARGFLTALGHSVEGLSDAQVAKMTFDPRVTGAHSTSDFSNVLANAMNKSLRAEYAEYPQLWRSFCNEGVPAPDFKEIKRTQLGEVPNLLVVKEGGEYKEVTIGDKKEVYSLAKYGRSFKHTWEMLVNDDLNAFTRTPRLMYRAAVRLEDVIAFAILTANANMSDSNALFSSAHANYVAGGSGAAPSLTTLNAMLLAMRKQTGLSSDVYLNLNPRFIIVPAALEGTVAELLKSPVKVGANNATSNIWQGRLEPIVHPILDADSATKWYAACDPADIDTIEVTFLEGYNQPTIEMGDARSPDERSYYVRHVVAAKAIDWRGLYLNAGA